MQRRSLITFAIIILIGGLIFTAIDRKVPSQHLPWRALDIEAPTGMATSAQLLRLSLSPSQTCTNMAERALSLKSNAAAPQKTKTVCGWNVARDVLGSANGMLAREVPMQCPLAVGTYIWMREIDGLAIKHLGSPVKIIHHFGTYSCRRQNGNSSNRWSEHAFANAWDIAAFELEDGRRISLIKHWKDGTREEKKFLRDVRAQACKIFRVTLSPDYNAAHKDHFHVDMGPTTACK